MPGFDAIVLAGGRARRMGGVDKTSLEVEGMRLLDRAIAAVAGAERVVVVGPPRDEVAGEIVITQESPPGGGPVAGLAAGLEQVEGELVAVLSADLPSIDGGLVAELVGAAVADGALAVDVTGRDQYLCAVYRTASLRAAVGRLGSPIGRSMHDLVATLDLARVPGGDAVRDIDEPDDLP